MDIVAKIDALRKERGWSVNKLATEAMLTQSTRICFQAEQSPKYPLLKPFATLLILLSRNFSAKSKMKTTVISI